MEGERVRPAEGAERPRPPVAAVVVVHGESPLLRRTAEAVLASEGVDVALAVVDNGGAGAVIDDVLALPGVVAVRPGTNTGFTGGCRLGAAAAPGDVIAFVNPDALVEPGALRALADALADPEVGLVSGRIELLDERGVLNSRGNPVHFSMLAWAGGWGEPMASAEAPCDVASVSGALFAVRRDVWDELGGFWDPMLAYGEDVELSLRTWLSGRRVRLEPSAVARHGYDFGRHPAKLHLLSRNRIATVLTVYQGRSLVVLAPLLLAVEAGITWTAWRGGWLPEQVAAWRWVAAHRGEVAARRRVVQAARQRSDAALAPVLSAHLSPSPRAGFAVPRPADAALAAGWAVARRLLPRRL